VTTVERAVRDHAERVIARDSRVRDDLVPGAPLDPGDLLDQLLAGAFQGYALVAHARIGAHHVFKTRFDGPTTFVVQARWVEDRSGRWRLAEGELAQIARTEPA
jgi:hypothetical protein